MTNRLSFDLETNGYFSMSTRLINFCHGFSNPL